MSPLVGLLSRLSQEGISLAVEGGSLAVSPPERVTTELREEIVRHRADLIELARHHGAALQSLFRDPPAWPPSRGRSGPVTGNWWQVVGGGVRLQDGREGKLLAVEYDTRSGRLRCCVAIGGQRRLLDPEDLVPGVVAAVREGRTA